MELREVRVFLIVCEELHFTRAAVRLRMAQSAVSQAVKRLEQEVGAPLLARTNRRVALTPAGESFRDQALLGLRELEHAITRARRVAAGQAGKLVLRFILMTALTGVPRVLARFKHDHPEVEIDVDTAGTTQQLEALRLGHCDIGFMALQDEVEGLATCVVQRTPLVALLPAQHALARRRSIRLAELSEESFVFLKFSSEPQLRARFRRRCVDAGFEPQIVLESEQLEVLLALVAAGMGVSCAPGIVRNLAFPGVVTIPLTPVIPAGISAVWHPTLLSPAGREFLALLRAARTT